MKAIKKSSNKGKKYRTTFYKTLALATKAAHKLKVKSVLEYLEKHNTDPLLHSNPQRYYKEEWQDWYVFLGNPRPIKKIKSPKVVYNHYKSVREATKAIKQLGIKNSAEYMKRGHEDPRLHSRPKKFYGDKWPGWDVYLGRGKIAGKRSPENLYKTLAEASKAAKKLGAKTPREYIKLYKANDCLPSNPSVHYKSEWTNWYDFLGTSKYKFYRSLGEASKAAIKLSIKNSRDYVDRYSLDPKLHSNPSVHYKNWKSWDHFLKRSG